MGTTSGPTPTPKPGTPAPKPSALAPGQGTPGAGGTTTATGNLIPVWMDVDTAKFLVRALTSALNQNIQPKKKKKK
jgi:hypothetical protein